MKKVHVRYLIPWWVSCITTCKAHRSWHIYNAKINFINSGAVDIIRTAHYIHGLALMKLISAVLYVSWTMGLTRCYKTEDFFTFIGIIRREWTCQFSSYFTIILFYILLSLNFTRPFHAAPRCSGQNLTYYFWLCTTFVLQLFTCKTYRIFFSHRSRFAAYQFLFNHCAIKNEKYIAVNSTHALSDCFRRLMKIFLLAFI